MILYPILYLASSVWITQDILLSKVAMGGEDHNIEDHRNSSEELLEGARVGRLEKVQKHRDHLRDALCSVSPPSLEPDLLKLVLKLIVQRLRRKGREILLGLPQNTLQRIQVLYLVIQHHSLCKYNLLFST